jgi:uncharacterized RDD family membrane protein YckC
MRLPSSLLSLGLLFGSVICFSVHAATEDAPPPVAPADEIAVAPANEVPPPAETASDVLADEESPAAERPAAPPRRRGAREDMRRSLEDGLRSGGSSGELFRVGGDILIGPGEQPGDTVAILGSIVAESLIRGSAVAVLGDVTLNAGGNDDVVAVLGNVTINGPVRGSVVSVFGTVQLGPEAEVRREVVAVGGSVQRAPGAVVQGEVVQLPFLPGGGFKFDGLRAWIQQCLMLGRPLAIGENLGWVWILTLSFFAFYLLLTLLFGRAMSRTAEVLESSPGMTLLTALLTLLLTPVLLVLLAFTGIGPFLFLPVLIVATLFGKAAFLTWMGRRVTGQSGRDLPVLATFVGGVILIGLYLVPVLGFVAQKLASFLGLGMAVYAALIAMRREPATATAAPGAPVPPVPPAAPAAMPRADDVPSPVPLRGPTVPGSVATSLLPRAGFWIRLGALALDVLLVAVLTRLMGLNGYFLVVFAAYAAILWSVKGSTIGGMICGLQVARLDDRPVEWSVALVRALAGFVSLIPLGLGFIWIAFDRDRQAWHDKIAGTVVVRPPRV